MKYLAQRCPCGHRACTDWHVWPVACNQGVGFTEEGAKAVVELLNKLDSTGTKTTKWSE